jgi:hypothetical protein
MAHCPTQRGFLDDRVEAVFLLESERRTLCGRLLDRCGLRNLCLHVLPAISQ